MIVFTLLNSEILPQTQGIEVSTSLQIPSFQIIGLPGPEVSEAKDRVKSAIENSGLKFPRRKVIVNLSPASVKKQGTGIDLAIAIGILLEEVPQKPSSVQRIFAWGELGLAGKVKPVGQITRAISAALREKADLLLISSEDLPQAQTSLSLFRKDEISTMRVIGVSELAEAMEAVTEPDRFPSVEILCPATDSFPTRADHLLPLPDELLRVLGIASAGRHHLLLLGEKGAGKSHALEWLIALQPEPDLETKKTQTYLSELSRKQVATAHRRVGAQVRAASLLGSFQQNVLRPGEFSLAHGGVLLADEFPEWSRDSREALREPLERGAVTLTRVQGSTELPARFLFAANGNLCPCGGIFREKYETGEVRCRCLPQNRSKYLGRISGPILDRIDLVYVLRKSGRRDPRPVEEIRTQVRRAREFQTQTYGAPCGELSGAQLEEILRARPEIAQNLQACGVQSLRDRHKTLRLALSLAAWDGARTPEMLHFIEARLYRGALLQTELDGLDRSA